MKTNKFFAIGVILIAILMSVIMVGCSNEPASFSDFDSAYEEVSSALADSGSSDTAVAEATAAKKLSKLEGMWICNDNMWALNFDNDGNYKFSYYDPTDSYIYAEAGTYTYDEENCELAFNPFKKLNGDDYNFKDVTDYSATAKKSDGSLETYEDINSGSMIVPVNLATDCKRIKILKLAAIYGLADSELEFLLSE